MTDDQNGARPDPSIESVEDLDDGWATAPEPEPQKAAPVPEKPEPEPEPQKAAPAPEKPEPEPQKAAPDTDAKAPPIRLRLYGQTDVGQIREHNEDNFIIADLTAKTRNLQEAGSAVDVGKHGVMLGVCDGMGGAAAGEVASQLAVDILFQKMSAGEPPADRGELARRLNEAVEAAGARIFKEATDDRARRGMGTTATISALIDDHLFLAEVGDSRGYILRGEKLVQVTRDQSLVNQLIEAGQLTEAEAETFEHNNIILQALGTSEGVQVDITYVELRRGDTLLLCSDGLSGMVRFDEIREILRTVDDLKEVCRQLIDKANQAGGHDNITVVVAKFEGDWLRPSSPDDEDLKYRKYSLPTPEAPTSGAGEGLRNTARDLGVPPNWQWETPAAAGQDQPSSHGPSKSKLGHTVVGAQMSSAAKAAISAARDQGEKPSSGKTPDDGDPILIPTSHGPPWTVGAFVLVALVLAAVAGYFLLR
jgi:PPM family protein phosphatase